MTSCAASTCAPASSRSPSASTASHAVAAPDYDSFAWQVLTTLATHAASDNRDGLYTVRLTMVPGHLEAGL